jgi:hypothetical protein
MSSYSVGGWPAAPDSCAAVLNLYSSMSDWNRSSSERSLNDQSCCLEQFVGFGRNAGYQVQRLIVESELIVERWRDMQLIRYWLAQLFTPAVISDMSVSQADDAIAVPLRLSHLCHADDYSFVIVFIHASQVFQYRPGRSAVETSNRVVGKNDVCLLHEYACNGGQLFLSVR